MSSFNISLIDREPWTLCPEEQVRQFGQIFTPDGFGEEPGFPADDVRALRLGLIKEEFQELLEAEEADDFIEVLDALADLIYVIYFYGHALGVDLDDIVEEVHASNMSKLDEEGEPIYRSDGKVLKGPNYFQPNLKQVLKNVYGVDI